MSAAEESIRCGGSRAGEPKEGIENVLFTFEVRLERALANTHGTRDLPHVDTRPGPARDVRPSERSFSWQGEPGSAVKNGTNGPN